jgi:hypothetical protein
MVGLWYVQLPAAEAADYDTTRPEHHAGHIGVARDFAGIGIF